MTGCVAIRVIIIKVAVFRHGNGFGDKIPPEPSSQVKGISAGMLNLHAVTTKEAFKIKILLRASSSWYQALR